MSLLGEYFEPCVMIDKTHEPDGYGGMNIAWVEGAEFDAAITLDSSMESKLAQKQGVTAVYTVTTQKSINLQFHDVLRRKSDGKVFRIKSDGDDKRTPGSATLNMRQVSAEEWELPAYE